MDTVEAIVAVGKRVQEQLGQVHTEAATNVTLVQPFISQVLGYDVSDPAEVIPEFEAPLGRKKDARVDRLPPESRFHPTRAESSPG